MAKYGEQFMKCPIFTAQSLIGGKWKVYLLWFIHDKPRRFGEISRILPEVTQTMLTNTLRELERDGLVHREVYRQVPPKVEYSLTPIGTRLIPALATLVEWGTEYMENRGTIDDPDRVVDPATWADERMAAGSGNEAINKTSQ
jgi:DNA-binding HxlR family transcriptional regulator